MSKASRDGARSAMNGYDRNPYKREPERSEWQEGYDRQIESERAEATERRRLASRSIYDMLSDGDLGEAISRIAEHLDILHDTPSE